VYTTDYVKTTRLKFPNALYHVTSRGDRRENIYEDDDDRLRFLEILGTVVVDYSWLCHGCCLMDNHYHLIIETPDSNLSKGMRQLNGVYSFLSILFIIGLTFTPRRLSPEVPKRSKIFDFLC